MALLTFKTVSPLVAITPRDVSTFGTRLRSIARIHRHRARLEQGGLIFAHLPVDPSVSDAAERTVSADVVWSIEAS